MRIVHSNYVASEGHANMLKKIIRRTRLVINKGKSFIILPVAKVAYFQVKGNMLLAIDFDQRKYLLDMSMNTLEEELESSTFFRANRQYILNITCIKSFENYFNGKLVVNTIPINPEKIIISRNKAHKFISWINS